MKQTTLFFIFLASVFTVSLSAQRLTYGFKAGLNFNKFIADSEQDDQGNNVESFNNNSSFHIGGAIGYNFTDNYGVRTELIFSIKGVEYIYDGQATHIFRDSSGSAVISSGTTNTILNVNNTYLDIPVMGFAKFGSLELSAGVSAGFLISSTASGEFIHSGTTSGGSNIQDLIIEMDHSYYKDDIGEASYENATILPIDGRNSVFPGKAGGYYFFTEDKGNFYKTIDLGLNVGASFYFNEGLFLGFRANMGLLDISNNDYDFSQVKLENGEQVSRADTERNLSYQLSIGFSF